MMSLLIGRRGDDPVVTQATMHVYANGSTGSDSNGGLTAETPKLTLQAVFDLVPVIVAHNMCIHLSGTFADAGSVTFAPHILPGVSVVIDGGSGLTDVVGSLTATASDIGYIAVDTGTGWTAEQWIGYLINVKAGAQSGRTRSIYQNGTDAGKDYLTVNRRWPLAPGLVSFSIARPATTINSSGLTLALAPSGGGRMLVQRIYTAGTTVLRLGGTPQPRFAGCVFNSHENGITITATGCGSESLNSLATGVSADHGGLTFGSQWCDPDNGFAETASWSGGAPAAAAPGCGIVTASGSLYCSRTALWAESFGSKSPIRADSSRTRLMGSCCPFAGVVLRDHRTSEIQEGPGANDWLSDWRFTYADAYPNRIRNASGVGLKLENSNIRLDCSNIFTGCSSHGIEAIRSLLRFVGGPTDGGQTANSGFACRAHSGSTVLINSADAPTFAGTLGQFSFDGANEASKWSDVSSNPLTSIAEMSMIKAYQ